MQAEYADELDVSRSMLSDAFHINSLMRKRVAQLEVSHLQNARVTAYT